MQIAKELRYLDMPPIKVEVAYFIDFWREPPDLDTIPMKALYLQAGGRRSGISVTASEGNH